MQHVRQITQQAHRAVHDTFYSVKVDVNPNSRVSLVQHLGNDLRLVCEDDRSDGCFLFSLGSLMRFQAVFEKHNVVFTIGASLASAGAAWAGYTARQSHQKKVEDRLNSLEHVMTTVHQMEEEQVKALIQQVGVSYKACAATAGTTLVIGYGLGFRGGRWYAVKRYQKQQQKLLQLEKMAAGKSVKPAAKAPTVGK